LDTPLSSALVLPVDVTPRTRWIFIQLCDADGTKGFGEATYGKNSAAVVEIANRLAATLIGSTPAKALASLPKPKTIIESAAISGLDQALHDLAARSQGVSIATLIGGERRRKVGLYANINRRTRDRTPAGFAKSAQVAIDAGYTAFKIAPFDEVTPEGCAEPGFNAALDSGLARIAAVRQAIGPQARLMVDCHWRFTEARASEAINACAAYKLHWFECPISEEDEFLPAIARLRERARAKGMLLAGGETMVGMEELAPLLDANAYDVIMPDVKYVGGLSEMLRMAEAQSKAGVAFSPHNPSGPVSYAASLEVCAAVGDLDLLEHQFDESPLFDSLVEGTLPESRGGVVELAAGRHGHAVTLSPQAYALSAEAQGQAV
jgi:galactonate dehydratase